MNLPDITIIDVVKYDLDVFHHGQSLVAQDYVGNKRIVDKVKNTHEDKNLAIKNNTSELYLLTNNAHILHASLLSEYVGALISRVGSTHLVYSDYVVVNPNNHSTTYVPCLGYDKNSLINFPSDFQGCFLFSRFLWEKVGGFESRPQDNYDFLLKCSEYSIFEHVSKNLVYTYYDSLDEQNNLNTTRQMRLQPHA